MLFLLIKKNYEDNDSTNKPHLKCLIDKEYLIRLDTDEPDNTFVCQLLRLNIQRQVKVVVQSIDNSSRRYKSLKKTEDFCAD